MSDADGPPTGPGSDPGGSGGEPVGSVGEEAAKLFGALSDWARDQGGEHLGAGFPGATGATGAAGAAGGMGQALGDAARRAEEHLATGGADCRWCPVCQVIAVVRQTSPEVRTHLSTAAGSLMQAAAALLATTPPGATQPVEKIDLDDGSVWDEQDWDGER